MDEPVSLPAFRGNLWRGVLGPALKRIERLFAVPDGINGNSHRMLQQKLHRQLIRRLFLQLFGLFILRATGGRRPKTQGCEHAGDKGQTSDDR